MGSEQGVEEVPACAEGGAAEEGNAKPAGGLRRLASGALGGAAASQQKQEQAAPVSWSELERRRAENIAKRESGDAAARASFKGNEAKQARCADYLEIKAKVDAWISKHSKVQDKRDFIRQSKEQKEKEDQVQYKFYQCISCACLKGKSRQQEKEEKR